MSRPFPRTIGLSIPLLAVLVSAAAASPGETLLSVGISLQKPGFEITSTRGMRIVDPADGSTMGKVWGESPVFLREVPGAGVSVRWDRDEVRPAVLLQPLMGGQLGHGGSRYRGQLLVRPDPGGRLNLVNLVDVEDYLMGVLPREMAPSAPAAALEAQAIASRTYALRHAFEFQSRGFGLKAGEGSQVYAGVLAETPETTRAVHATRGTVLYFGDELVHAWFSASCGGRTADHRSVWGGSRAFPYARSLECRACRIYPQYHWSVEVPLEDLSRRLTDLGRGIGPVSDVAFEWGADGRVIRADLTGGKGRLSLSGNEFRILAGHRRVRSLKFAPLEVEGQAPARSSSSVEERAIRDIIGKSLAGKARTGLTLEGTGFGHGVGLCQWGARGMAEERHSAAAILARYYPGSRVRAFAGFDALTQAPDATTGASPGRG